MQDMSASSRLSFSTNAANMDFDDKRLTLTNTGPETLARSGISLKISSNTFLVQLDAQGSSGYNPVIQWSALSTRPRFSWGFTIILAACTIICTCFAWAAWMLKAYIDHRRGFVREQLLQLELAAQRMPAAVTSESCTVKGPIHVFHIACSVFYIYASSGLFRLHCNFDLWEVIN